MPALSEPNAGTYYVYIYDSNQIDDFIEGQMIDRESSEFEFLQIWNTDLVKTEKKEKLLLAIFDTLDISNTVYKRVCILENVRDPIDLSDEESNPEIKTKLITISSSDGPLPKRRVRGREKSFFTGHLLERGESVETDIILDMISVGPPLVPTITFTNILKSIVPSLDQIYEPVGDVALQFTTPAINNRLSLLDQLKEVLRNTGAVIAGGGVLSAYAKYDINDLDIYVHANQALELIRFLTGVYQYTFAVGQDGYTQGVVLNPTYQLGK